MGYVVEVTGGMCNEAVSGTTVQLWVQLKETRYSKIKVIICFPCTTLFVDFSAFRRMVKSWKFLQVCILKFEKRNFMSM